VLTTNKEMAKHLNIEKLKPEADPRHATEALGGEEV
jgi:hypothetical protein